MTTIKRNFWHGTFILQAKTYSRYNLFCIPMCTYIFDETPNIAITQTRNGEQ